MTAKDHKTSSTAAFKNKFKSTGEEDAVENVEFDEQEPLLEHPSYVELQGKLTAAEEKATQYYERMLRMQAEHDNMQRRAQRDIEGAHKYALEKFILELLPVIDSLERAVTLPEDHQHSVLEGVNLTLTMLYTALNKFGIQQIDPLAEPFNPELHQAVSTQIDPSVAPNTVLNVLQKGYLLNNRLVRPALVIVSKIS